MGRPRILDGLTSGQRWILRNPEKHKITSRERNRKYREQNPDKCAEARARYKWSAKGKRKVADRDRFKTYGIKPEEYDVLILRAAGYCELCSSVSETSGQRELVLDHCHVTGRIRGLICQLCNRLLGLVERYDIKKDWMTWAMEYRENF